MFIKITCEIASHSDYLLTISNIAFVTVLLNGRRGRERE